MQGDDDMRWNPNDNGMDIANATYDAALALASATRGAYAAAFPAVDLTARGPPTRPQVSKQVCICKQASKQAAKYASKHK